MTDTPLDPFLAAAARLFAGTAGTDRYIGETEKNLAAPAALPSGGAGAGPWDCGCEDWDGLF